MPGAYDRSRNAAVVREISANFEAAVSSFFGTRTPNREAAQGAHDAYVAALRAHGTDVTVLPGLDEHPDCCFVEDTAVMVDGKAIIPNMGHHSREGEQVAVAEHLSSSAEIIKMPEGATLDGGDVVFFDDRYLNSTPYNRMLIASPWPDYCRRRAPYCISIGATSRECDLGAE